MTVSLTKTIISNWLIKSYGETDLIETTDKLKSGYTPAEADALVTIEKQVITDVLSQVTASAVTGITGANSDNGVLYLKISESSSDNVLEVFSDSAREAASLVANVTDTSKAGGVLTLAAANASGIGGTITITATAVAEAASSIESLRQISRYDSTASNQVVKGLVKEYIATNGYVEVYPRADAKLDGIGKDSVTDRFTKNAMILAFRDKGINLT